jgi:leucyl aminopeptidase
VFDVSKFEDMGLGSFYGVARGAKEPAKMIVIEYNGGNKKQKPIALVGKGVTFDTGGISLKPPSRMDEMKFDMCGSATVMGVMNAVSILQPKLNMVFAIGATENMPGSDAQRPGDIVMAYNGKTIEVLNTDAEGRLVLADVLSYVNKHYKPAYMIDFATLTGAVLVALGNRASGLMGNDEKLINKVKKSSKATDEKVWELPLWPEYTREIKSPYADLKNIGNAGLAGTITAGAFLKEFVGDTPWCHLDIAGSFGPHAVPAISRWHQGVSPTNSFKNAPAVIVPAKPALPIFFKSA